MSAATAKRSATGWRNWTGDQACTPARILAPRSRDELCEAIAAETSAGHRVRVRGSGHSFTEAALTNDTMLDLGALSGVLDADPASGLVTVGGGTVLADLNEALDDLGLAMENLGDIDRQTVAGAISTATHGTGASLRNISAQVEALQLVLADGTVRALTTAQPDLLRAARVGVGALGAIAAVTLRSLPAFTLHRVDEPRPLDDVLGSFHDLAAANDHFEFFVFPHTDKALTIRRNRTEEPPHPRGAVRTWVSDVVVENGLGDLLLRVARARPSTIPRFTRLAAQMMSQGEHPDRSHRIFANRRTIRFTEMEYALPRPDGPEALRRVLELIERRH